MEFMTGVKEKETLELSGLLEEGRLGEEVKVNGAVHTIRDMGTVAFVILRKREGLVQCVYEEGVTKFDLKDLREAATVEVTGKLTESEKAPNGIEIRLSEIKVLSMPKDSLPLAVSKWRDVYKRQIRDRSKPVHRADLRGWQNIISFFGLRRGWGILPDMRTHLYDFHKISGIRRLRAGGIENKSSV